MYKLQKIILLLLLISNVNCLFSQNLIKNGDFETYDKCPISYRSKKQFLPEWYSPTRGTPDYFNRCSRSKAGIPNNFAGTIDPVSGDGCIGIIAADLSRSVGLKYGWSREYIATRLIDKLEKDNWYCISFYVSLSDYSKMAIQQIGVYFSHKKVSLPIKHELEFEPQVMTVDSFIVNRNKWQLITGKYKAQGNERYIIIGNFQSDNDLSWIKLEEVLEKQLQLPFSIGAYYYMDDVKLVKIIDESECGSSRKEDFTY